MIDFPASPTVGQLATLTNGVTYRWDGTIWVATGSSAGGDFCAVRTGSWALSTTATVVGSLSVASGNANSWLNISTGRYTPPAGRYSVFAKIDARHNTSTTATYIAVRKNGTDIPGLFSSTNSTAALTAHVSVEGTVDANGTDYFEIAVTGVTGGTNGEYFIFGAFPISGIQGPPGPSGPASTGDFCANQISSMPTVPGSGAYATLILTQVISGNSPVVYSTSTGRYTPPAGRFCIYAGYSVSTSQASHAYLRLRKNGTVIQDAADTVDGVSYYAAPSISVIVDCTGTDWFDIQGAMGQAASGSLFQLVFQAYPVSGIKGPPGDIGAVTGVIVDFAGLTAPEGWLLCQGQSVTVAAYGALHAVIGYQFGGSGLNFNVPDLGGRVTAGKEATATRLTTAGAGIDGATLGAAGGTQTHVLTVAQLASHSHDIYVIGATSGLSGGANFNLSASTPSGAAGGNAAHQNTQPTMIINKIIKT